MTEAFVQLGAAKTESLPKVCPWFPESKESCSSESFKLLSNNTLRLKNAFNL